MLQESAVTYAFLLGALPLLEKDGIDLRVYYVSSAELFDLLPIEEQQAIFPAERAAEAIGITGFTLPTMHRWIRSDLGRGMTLHPFRNGHFLGSGQGSVVLREAGLDGAESVPRDQGIPGRPQKLRSKSRCVSFRPGLRDGAGNPASSGMFLLPVRETASLSMSDMWEDVLLEHRYYWRASWAGCNANLQLIPTIPRAPGPYNRLANLGTGASK